MLADSVIVESVPSPLPPVLVLAAGLGTRAQPLSAVRAKPALAVGGLPLIARILQWLAGHGAREVIVNLHHRAETITRIVGDGRAFGLDVRYSWEWPLLGSGGGPARAFTLVSGDDLLVVNGDTLVDCDPAALMAAHHASGAGVTLTLIENPRPAHYGGVLLDAGDAVTDFTRRGAEPAGWHFVGVQAIRRDALDGISPDEPSESVVGFYRTFLRERPGLVRGWRTEAQFIDIGTPADYLEASLQLAGGDPGRLLGASSVVDPSSQLERTVVWDRARIASAVRLTECIVTDDVLLPSRARYHRAVLARHAPVTAPDAAGVWAYDLDNPSAAPTRVV
jgi:NDP-sugar pyrophosphorylase family protein